MNLYSAPEMSPNSQELEPWHEIVQFGPSFIQEAREMRSRARHHAGFRVGAVAIASSIDGEVNIFRAANRNLYPGPNETKLCAEQNIIWQMRSEGFDTVHALFISGPPQPDTQSGVVSPTLHSCGECRDFMEDAPEMGGDSLLIHVHPQEEQYEIYSLAELVAIHEAGPSTRLPLNHYLDPALNRWKSAASRFEQFIRQRWPGDDEPVPSLGGLAHLAIAGTPSL